MARKASLGGPFWHLFTASAVSALGDGLVIVGFPLTGVTLTTNPLLIAGVAVAGRVPAFLFSIPVGALADRVDRRNMMVAVNWIRALILAFFSVAVVEGHDSLAALYITVFLLGAGAMAFDVAAQACLPAMVPPADLPRANGYLFTAEVSGEQVAGPGLAGLAFAIRAVAALHRRCHLFRPVGLVGSFLVAEHSAAARAPTIPAGHPRRAQLVFLQPSHAAVGPGGCLLGVLPAMVFSELVLYGTRQLGLGHVGYGLFFRGSLYRRRGGFAERVSHLRTARTGAEPDGRRRPRRLGLPRSVRYP